jgi:hypothetical protein
MEGQRSNRSYLAVAFGLLALVAVAYGGVSWLTRRMPQQHPVLAATVASTTPLVNASPVAKDVPVVAVPTLAVSSWPTPIADGPTTEAPHVEVPWTVTKMIDPRSHQPYWMAPSDVIAQVRHDYQAMEAYHDAHIFDTSPEELKRFYVEPMLDTVMKQDQDSGSDDEVRGVVKFVRPELQVLGFSVDGRAVQVAQEFHGETVPVYNRRTRQLVREDKLPVGVAISTLVYDMQDQRWKMSDSRFVPGPPGVQ